MEKMRDDKYDDTHYSDGTMTDDKHSIDTAYFALFPDRKHHRRSDMQFSIIAIRITVRSSIAGADLPGYRATTDSR